MKNRNNFLKCLVTVTILLISSNLIANPNNPPMQRSILPAMPLAGLVWYVNDNSLIGDIYTTSTGNDANPGTSALPFATINFAVGAATAGDTIYVDAGTYTLTSVIVVNKQLTFRGRQAGVDARTRSGPESIVDAINLTGYISAIAVQPAANGSIIDGFTEQAANGDGNFGGGIWLQQGTNGTTVQNNIIQNNIVGIFPANNSAINQTLITKNLFQNNTNPGPSSGHHIYADEYTASTNLQNVLVKDNKFTNSSPVSSSYAMGMSNTGATAFTNITFQDNQVSNQGRGVYFFGTTSSTVSGNTFTDATSTAVGIYSGGISNASFSITGNTFTNCFRGITISKFSPIDAYTGTLTPTGNTFTGGTYHLVNSSNILTATVINAIGNTYDGVLLNNSTSLPNIFTIADKVLDAVDVSIYGIIILKPFNEYVTINSFYVPAGTTTPLIQRAVNIADPADTVNVNSGSYTEQIELDQDQVLIGQGAGSTIVISPATLPLFFTTSTNNHPVIYAHDAANIVVKKLTVDGAGKGNANHRFNGVGYFQAGGCIEDLEVKAVRNNPIDGAQGGTGIFVYSNTGTARAVNVKGNNVYDFQKNGITMAGLVLTAYVDSNKVTGAGPVNFIAQNGVQLSTGATGSITKNTIAGVSYTPATVVSCGVLVFGASGLVTTLGNTVNNAQAGIYYYQSSGLINSNVVSYNAVNMGATPYWYGVEVQNGTTTVSQNTVNGGGDGVGIQADAVTGLDVSRIESDAVSEYNSMIEAGASGQMTTMNAINNFVDSTDEGFVTKTAGTGAVDISIVHNSITNIIGYAIHNYGTTIQYDTCNWYGTDDSTFITNNKISGPVIFIPYLTEGDDVEPATPGFQPCPDCCIKPFVLPVEMSSFISLINRRDVTLNWSTASETNNSRFDIERSINEQWSSIGSVQGNGTTQSQSNYSFSDRNLNTGLYYYRLKQIDFNGNFAYFNLSNEVSIGTPTKFDLSQNYPNPFNPSTTINYDLPYNGKATLKIFDISGKEVSTLINEFQTAGYYTISFNGNNLSSGIYFYSLTSNDLVSTKRMLLVK